MSECQNCFISIIDTVYVLLSSFLLIINFAVISIAIRVLKYIFCAWVDGGVSIISMILYVSFLSSSSSYY